VRVVATFPDTAHPPIVYPAALTVDAKPGAAQFMAYLQTQQARIVFQRAGFTVLPPR
jgi:molybdate transport system substrate-binding protein